MIETADTMGRLNTVDTRVKAKRRARPGVCGWRLPAVWLLAIAGGLSSCPAQEAQAPQVFAVPLRIEPTQQRIGTLPVFDPRWWLPADLAPVLPRLALREALAARLLAAVERDGSGAAWIVPDASLLDRFTNDERQRWSAWLATEARNRWHRWPVYCSPGELARLEARQGWAEAVSRVRRWGIPHRDGFLLCEPAALDGAFGEPSERRAFFQEIFGATTHFVKIVSEDESNEVRVAHSLYWQVHGRYRAVEPFLNAVAAVEGHERVDIAHLLPRLPRSLLYSYPPSLAEAEDPDVESGMLAMDFFRNEVSDEAGGETPDLAAWLARMCVPVPEASQYGDIIVWGDPAVERWPYAAVHIVRDLVLARRPVAFGPWVFMRVGEVAEINPRLAGERRVFRLRTAFAPAEPPPYVLARSPAAWRRRLALRPLPPGPWGRLWTYDILLAPAGDVLESLPAPAAQETWTFDGVTDDEVRHAIEALGSEELTARMQRVFEQGRRDDRGRLSVQPSLDLVLDTPASFRARLFPCLVGGTGASDAVQFIPFPTDIPIEQWFDAGSLPDAARQVLTRLAYPTKGGFAISDYGALYHVLDTRAERLAAQRAALRVPAQLVLLERPRPGEIPELERYWSRNEGRNVRQLLESFSASEGMRFLDVVQLLPPVAREFLNTYFMSDGSGPVPSCLWTTFNFDAEMADQRFLVLPDTWTEDGKRAWIELMSTCTLIDAPERLGDMIVYRRRGADEILHACTYVAADVCYTKNGFTFSSPWHLARLEVIDALYLGSADVEKVYFRRVRP